MRRRLRVARGSRRAQAAPARGGRTRGPHAGPAVATAGRDGAGRSPRRCGSRSTRTRASSTCACSSAAAARSRSRSASTSRSAGRRCPRARARPRPSARACPTAPCAPIPAPAPARAGAGDAAAAASGGVPVTRRPVPARADPPGRSPPFHEPLPMASLAHHLYSMACNNAWANHRLLAACARLSQEEFVAAQDELLPVDQGHAQPHPHRRLVLRRRARARVPQRVAEPRAGQVLRPRGAVRHAAARSPSSSTPPTGGCVTLCAGLTDADVDRPGARRAPRRRPDGKRHAAARPPVPAPDPPPRPGARDARRHARSRRRSSTSSSAPTRRTCAPTSSPRSASAKRRSGNRDVSRRCRRDQRDGRRMKYRGSCHCGRIAFEVEGTLDGGDGLQLLDLPAQGIAAVVRAAHEHASSHARGERRRLHLPQARHQAPLLPGLRHPSLRRRHDPKGNAVAAINIRCLEDVDLASVAVTHFDGRSK